MLTTRMAKLDTSVCPKCGAPVEVRRGVTEIRCSYCGTLAQVQQGRRPLPPSNFGGPPMMVVRVPARGPSPAVWILPVVIAVGGAVVGLLASVRSASLATDATSGGSGGSGGLFAQSWSFDDTPMLADVNGDGVPDVVGHCDSGSKTHYLAAFEGATGKQLWKAPPAPKEAFDGKRALVGNLLVAVDDVGKVQATRIANGTPAWSGLLGDKAASFCADGASVIIEAADDTFTRFDLATGKKSAVDLHGKRRPECTPVYQTRGATPRYELVDWADFREHDLPELHSIPGMSAYRALVPTKPGLSFMIGSREKGTSVGMVAAVENGEVLWKEIIPGVDPLETDINVTTVLAASDGQKVVIPYSMTHGKKGVRMACFDGRTGARQWDVQVHTASQVDQGITIEAGRVYYSSWTALYVLSLADGKGVYELGYDF